MSTASPDYDSLFKLFPAFAARSQAVGRITAEAFAGIAVEQARAAESCIEFGTEALRLPRASAPAEMLTRQIELQSRLADALGERAERIFHIAATAGDKAMETWMDLVDDETESEPEAEAV